MSNYYLLLLKCNFFPTIFEINIVLQKLYMVIWVGCTTLKVTFPQKEQYSSFDNFKFFLCEDSREIYKFTDLAKLLFLMQIEFFQFLSKFCINSWDIHSSKNNSGVSRSSYFLDICICYFWNWKYFSDIWKNNSLLSKLMLKYLVYCQEFWVKVRRLQDQCGSIWTLVCYFFVSNILQH